MTARLLPNRLVPWLALLAAALGFPLSAWAEQELVYVKKATREETLRASLAASGLIELADRWWLIGPFENRRLNQSHPVEQKIDLKATYQGKSGPVRWRPVVIPAGKEFNLKRLFRQSDFCACYLYQQVEVKKAARLHLSLGSDDGIVLWLNGKRLLYRDVERPVGPGQEQVTLPLQPGKNHLLVKIGNVRGEWGFYYRPQLPQRLMVKLQRRLDRDFPPTEGEARHYLVQTLPLPEGELIEGGGLVFRPDGKLYVATRRGDIWLVENPTAEDPDQVRWRRWATGLHEVLGLCLVPPGRLYVAQRPELTLVEDTDGDERADRFTTVCDQFGLSGNYHEYCFGPARDAQGNFFLTLNLAFGGGHQSRAAYRGWCVKVTPQGRMIPWAFGLRSPNGVQFAPDGRLYYTDNQGEWVAACKMHEVRRGEFYGHVASVRWAGLDEKHAPRPVPPAVWFPYWMSRSVSEPVWDTTGGRFGPFTGQCIVGDQTNSLLMRVMLEEVGGRMQGAVTLFRTGFQCGVNRLEFAPDGSLFVAETNRGWGSVGGQVHGLQRVVYTGRVPFEVLWMKVTPQGWRLRFTKPVNRARAARLETYFLESYTYHYWSTYGSPEIKRRENRVARVELSPDGYEVHLHVPKRQTGRVFHLQLRQLTAGDGSPLLHADLYYTLNAVPQGPEKPKGKQR